MKKLICTITGLITILGALNWGLVGLIDMDVVQVLFKTMPAVAKAVYILIGLSGLVYGAMELSENRLF